MFFNCRNQLKLHFEETHTKYTVLKKMVFVAFMIPQISGQHCPLSLYASLTPLLKWVLNQTHICPVQRKQRCIFSKIFMLNTIIKKKKKRPWRNEYLCLKSSILLAFGKWGKHLLKITMNQSTAQVYTYQEPSIHEAMRVLFSKRVLSSNWRFHTCIWKLN